MMNGTAVRLCIVAALIPVTYWGAGLVKASLEPPKTEMPDWTFRDMPIKLGGWRGEETTMDPRIAVATNAKLDTIVNRAYRDDSGHVISIHAAMFEDPNGVLHSPLVCYQAAGWTRLSESRKTLHLNFPDKSELTVPISISRWESEKENRKVVVIYWFQLGEHFLFGRWDLGLKIRWSLRGREKWPALIKVMMEIPVIEGEDPQSTALALAEQVAAWENQPAHRSGKGMDCPPIGVSGGRKAANP